MKKFFFIGVILSAAFAFADVYDIGEAMKDESFWTCDPGIFLNRHQKAHGFKFTSDDHAAADSRREGAVAYFGKPVYESRLMFGDPQGVTRVELTLFTRGGMEKLDVVDLGGGQKLQHVKRVEKKMAQEEFFATLDVVRTKLTPAGRKPPKIVRENMKDTNIRQQSQVWPHATLTWNYEMDANKKFAKAGFIRLAVENPAAAKPGAAKLKTSKAKTPKLTENIARDSRGDVYVDGVPMVDQGQKGYCAVATAERLLRYYGLDVDEHELAVMAETKAEGGTSTEAMIATVTAIGKKHKLAVDKLYGDADKSVEERINNLTDEVRQYNKAAKKLKKPLIRDDDYITRSGNMISYSPAAVDAKKDVEVLKELKVNRSGKPQYMKFLKNIHQYVNEGKPLIWGVTLGMYAESDLPQASGGHMRLIIGYNDKKGEILYSDSWGKGHELKRMKTDWAWTITHSLLALRPLK